MDYMMREVEKELRAKYKALDPDDFITYATEKISHADHGILRTEMMEREAKERRERESLLETRKEYFDRRMKEHWDDMGKIRQEMQE